MKLIDLSYLMNLILDNLDSSAEQTSRYLGFDNYDVTRAWLLTVYGTMPATLQEFLKDAENPQTRKNLNKFNQICQYFPLEAYA